MFNEIPGAGLLNIGAIVCEGLGAEFITVPTPKPLTGNPPNGMAWAGVNRWNPKVFSNNIRNPWRPQQ